MLFLLRILLLVLSLAGIAHAAVLAPQQLVTSLLHAGDAAQAQSEQQQQQQHQGLLSLEPKSVASVDSVTVRAASSVVQDWSLVCKQLCGAGLGGVSCASYCDANDVSEGVQQHKSNAIALLKKNKNLICQDLCGLQLGGEACDCAQVETAKETTNMEKNRVCSSFCDHENTTLPGCSLCVRIKSFVGAKVLATAHQAKSNGDDEEPDWVELCKSLCRTGDGGSLCNCDLSPFLLRE